ncbi:hypothetical protein ACS0TY_034780 [Phlomoides rotata]
MIHFHKRQMSLDFVVFKMNRGVPPSVKIESSDDDGWQRGGASGRQRESDDGERCSRRHFEESRERAWHVDGGVGV